MEWVKIWIYVVQDKKKVDLFWGEGYNEIILHIFIFSIISPFHTQGFGRSKHSFSETYRDLPCLGDIAPVIMV